MKIKVIADEFTCSGFRLAGLDTVTVESRKSVESEFASSVEDEDIGLIFITEEKAELIREMVDEQKIEGEMPLVVEIPTRDGWKVKNRALQLINRTLSIKL